MRKTKAFLIIFIIIFYPLVLITQARAEALTLEDCYALSLKQSETIAINKETIKEAEAHFLQALGTLLPHASFVVNEYRQDLPTPSAVSLKKSYENNFNFTQTLFTGFKEFISIAGSKVERAQYVYQLKRAEQLLLVDVADAFYLLIEQREDQKTLQTTRVALISRVSELKQRGQLGRSRQSEVVNAQTQLYNIQAQIELNKSQEAVARHLLEFLIGKSVDEIVDSGIISAPLTSEMDYIFKMAQRPDVRAAQQAWDVARKKAAIAKTDLLPNVSVSGNYYTDRTTVPSDSKWDAALTVNVPIFEGTETYGSIKEANAKAREAEFQFRQTQRQAIQDIKDSYTRFQAGILNRDALRKSLASARMNYKLQKKDYQLNLVNNLDVLAAIQTLENARMNYIHALYDTKRLYWQLLAAVGEATMEK